MGLRIDFVPVGQNLHTSCKSAYIPAVLICLQSQIVSVCMLDKCIQTLRSHLPGASTPLCPGLHSFPKGPILPAGNAGNGMLGEKHCCLVQELQSKLWCRTRDSVIFWHRMLLWHTLCQYIGGAYKLHGVPQATIPAPVGVLLGMGAPSVGLDGC